MALQNLQVCHLLEVCLVGVEEIGEIQQGATCVLRGGEDKEALPFSHIVFQYSYCQNLETWALMVAFLSGLLAALHKEEIRAVAMQWNLAAAGQVFTYQRRVALSLNEQTALSCLRKP